MKVQELKERLKEQDKDTEVYIPFLNRLVALKEVERYLFQRMMILKKYF